ncbi:hypothetical protein ACCO45_006047 [Purpureocillium lilacinum]|uniref:Uncharacterized protein n=1 Tax=Purpureocillium lilacinum TaxID=33203 RepID=A0ACC4DX42_PURLI
MNAPITSPMGSRAVSSGPLSSTQQSSPANAIAQPAVPQPPAQLPTSPSTDAFLKDFTLVAEAAKRAQVAVMVREFESCGLRDNPVTSRIRPGSPRDTQALCNYARALSNSPGVTTRPPCAPPPRAHRRGGGYNPLQQPRARRLDKRHRQRHHRQRRTGVQLAMRPQRRVPHGAVPQQVPRVLAAGLRAQEEPQGFSAVGKSTIKPKPECDAGVVPPVPTECKKADDGGDSGASSSSSASGDGSEQDGRDGGDGDGG